MTALSGVRLMEEPFCFAAFTDKISDGYVQSVLEFS